MMPYWINYSLQMSICKDMNYGTTDPHMKIVGDFNTGQPHIVLEIIFNANYGHIYMFSDFDKHFYGSHAFRSLQNITLLNVWQEINSKSQIESNWEKRKYLICIL